MQTVTQSVADVCYVMGVPRSRVSNIARAMIDAGLLPKSSGRAIKKIDAGQMTGLVAAVAMADRVEDAPTVAMRFLSLRLEGKPDGLTFQDAFAENLTTTISEACPEIIFSRTRKGFIADVRGAFSYAGDLCEGKLPFWEAKHWGGFTKTSFTLSKGGFEVLRNLSRRDNSEI